MHAAKSQFSNLRRDWFVIPYMTEATTAGHPARPFHEAGIHGRVKHEGERRSVSAGAAAAVAPCWAGTEGKGVVGSERNSALSVW